MSIAILFPRFDHPAIEERYASWQAEMRLRSEGAVYFYDEDDKARDAVDDVDEELCLVITDPLIILAPGAPSRLAAVLGNADVAVPATREATDDRQRLSSAPDYLTLREFEAEAEALRAAAPANAAVRWVDADPGAFVCRTSLLRSLKTRVAEAIKGREVVIVRSEYAHQWTSMRGALRTDLLDRVPPDAGSILEFGCGEGTLGAALKSRQRCRVVGIEIDPQAAALARRHLDDVYCGDATHLVTVLEERFDCIIGGDIVEHLAEPWTFLGDLRALAAPGARLLLSIPNLANASVVGDLLQGRFDYVYMGITCAGHLRFFTRRSIEDMLAIAGWTIEAIEPQPSTPTATARELMAKLDASGLAYSREDLITPGYYVTARRR